MPPRRVIRREAHLPRGDDQRAGRRGLGAPDDRGRLVRWVGPHATADPVPGGALRCTHPNGATVVGRFVELVEHRRLVFTYGWEGDLMGVPPESTTVEIDLIEEDGMTTVRLVHHGLPPRVVRDHEQGCAYFLGVLRDAVVGR